MSENKEKVSVGLKKLRRNSESKKPEHKCDNCGCNRYSPCNCKRKEK